METARYEPLPMPKGCRNLIDVKRLWIKLSAERQDRRFINDVGTRRDDLAYAEIAEVH
jgi:hypothetical protein